MKDTLLSTVIAIAGLVGLLVCNTSLAETEPLCISGIYPHLTMHNSEGECGTGAVVPWAGRLWAITYAPHKPKGSTDKLYEIAPDLGVQVRPESIGGTPANRMIHRESNQLFIGSYAIDADGNVRVIPFSDMMGRHTANARHLTDPENRIYYGTMEEGFYDVDVKTLEVTTLYDDNHVKDGNLADLPGAHGKGLYSGQGRLIYANNGEKGRDAMHDPTVTAGVLAEWDGTDWRTVIRAQFTDITGPGGIHGNENPATDPVWAMGWDARSLIFALLDDGKWSQYRLPKGSHSYDGGHGWNTEWPRIREIGETDLLATMHGTFWRFPVTFSRQNSAGIAPRSNYLKVIGDFCRWNDRIVLGCDDSAQKEFLNTRHFKAKHGAPKESNSNLWFVESSQIDALGPVIGRGSVWLLDNVKANAVSDPYLFSGYDYRLLHLKHGEGVPVTFTVEVDKKGTDEWTSIREITVDAKGSERHLFEADETGAWIRLKAGRDATGVTAHFQYRNRDSRPVENSALFAGVATPGEPAATRGVMRSLDHAALGIAVGRDAYYALNLRMELTRKEHVAQAAELIRDVAQPRNAYRVDAASVIIEEDGKRYRFPKSNLYVTEDTAATRAKTRNLAEGATITASSMLKPDYAAANIVDGDRSEKSRWVSAQSGKKWIELDLGKAQEFRCITVASGWKNQAEYAVRTLTVQTSVGGRWKTLPGGEVRGNDSVEFIINLPQPVTARTIRLVSTDEGYVRIYEVGVFNESLSGDASMLSLPRICREVATERDLLNLHGTFYELPARNAQGMAKVRPVATHNLAIHDFCSHAGLLFFTGLDAETEGEHIVRSADGKVALWAGVVDDLWKLGKPRGQGGPWKDTAVKAGVPSDPYLMTAYDRKSVELSASDATTITLEVDVDGTGLWVPYDTFDVKAAETISHRFPDGFSAYWVRATSDRDTTGTAQFCYE